MSIPPIKPSLPQQDPRTAIADRLKAQLGNPIIQALFAQAQQTDGKAAEALSATHLVSQESPPAAAGAGAGAPSARVVGGVNAEQERIEIERLASLHSEDFRKQLKRAKQGNNPKTKELVEAARRLREERMGARKAKTAAVAAPQQLSPDAKAERIAALRRDMLGPMKEFTQNFLVPAGMPHAAQANAAFMANVMNHLMTGGREVASPQGHPTLEAQKVHHQKVGLLLMQTLPAINNKFPRWLIWCYAVDQLMQKVLPNEAGKWWMQIPLYKGISDLQMNLFLNLTMCELATCYSPEACKDSIERGKQQLQLLKNQALLKKGAEAERLCLLLDDFPQVLKEDALPRSFPINPDALGYYQQIRDIVLFFDSFHQTQKRVVKKLSDLLPRDPKEIDYKQFFHIFRVYAQDTISSIRSLLEQTKGKMPLRNASLTRVDGRIHRTKITDEGVLIADEGTARAAGAILTAEFFRILGGISISLMDALWTNAQKEELAKTTDRVERACEKDFVPPSFTIQSIDFAKASLSEFLKNKLLSFLNKISFTYATTYHRLNALTASASQDVLSYKQSSLIESFFPHIVAGMCYESTLKNLDFHLSSLTQARVQILVIFRDFFQSLDEATLKEHGQALLEAVKKGHVQLALPLYNRFQLLFGLAKLGQDHRFDLTEESFVGNDQEPTIMQPLVDYLALAGLEQILDKVMKAKRKPVLAAAAPSELHMANLPPAVSQQVAKPAHRAEPTPPPLPKGKKQPLVHAQAAPAAAAPLKKEVEEEELALFKTNANERRKVLAMLLEAGFEIRREGGSHTILAHSQAGQFPLPRHTTLSTGVVHKAAQAAGAAAAAGAGNFIIKDKK